MRYERVKDLVRLAVRLQAAYGGLTLDDIRDDFGVSRRTAERLRDAVEAVFGPLEPVDTNDTKRHWRLRSGALGRLVTVSVEELAKLGAAATALERSGLEKRATLLRELAARLRATRRSESLKRIESDLEALVHAEGLATRPGPRERLDTGLLALLREAITTTRIGGVSVSRAGDGTAKAPSRPPPTACSTATARSLVASTDRHGDLRLWRLMNMIEAQLASETFERDPTFDLERYAERSFGTCQEEPVRVVLRFDANVARDVSTFLFHPQQSVEENADGSLTVRFEAGGVDEMCRHLFTWGESVTILKPERLRRRLARMCVALARHHGERPGVSRSATTTTRNSKRKPAGSRRTVALLTPRFADYEHKLRSLPADPTASDLIRDDYLLAREGRLAVFYAPLHGVTPDAQVVIVGLTPGRSQMVAAFREARTLLHEGSHPSRLFREISRRIAFAGTMRTNLVQMLNRIGVAECLGLDTCAELFGDASHRLHSTSALRYPVFFKGNNYRGSPRIRRSHLLTDIVNTNLPSELEQFPNALIVPLGKAVEEALDVAGFGESPPLQDGRWPRRINDRSRKRGIRAAIATSIPLRIGGSQPVQW